MTRRIPLAIGASIGVHLIAAALVVGHSLWNAWPSVPVDVEITGVRLEDLHELPLGPAPAGGRPGESPIAPPTVVARRDGPSKPKPKPLERPAAFAADAGVNPPPAPPRPTSVRSYAPEGSRVTALLRLDRVRGTPYAQPLDGLLLHLPDRRDLLAGTDIDLFRDVDAVLIATPNPLDVAVTLLAVRHRLSDRTLRAALDRGARSTGRKLDWQTERGRPFAERRSAAAGAPPSRDAPPGRDDRLILLAAPNLAVVAPPAYRALILGARAKRPAASAASALPAAANGGAAGDAGAASVVTPAGGTTSPAATGNDWTALLDRIAAEDSVLPVDAVAMLSVVDLFSARSFRRGMNVAPGARGAVDDGPASTPAASAGTVLGLPVPKVMNATLGIAPQPFADVDAAFPSEADASRWEQEWPAMQLKLRSNPLVVLTGFSALVGRVTLARDGASLHLHIDATELETTRILELASAQLSAIGR